MVILYNHQLDQIHKNFLWVRYIDLLKVQVFGLKTLLEDKKGGPHVVGERLGSH